MYFTFRESPLVPVVESRLESHEMLHTDYTFAELLLVARKRSGQAQKVIAQKAGIDPSYLASMEAGRKGAPSGHVLNALLAAIDASAEDRLKIYQAACAERVGREIELIFPATIRSDTLELLSTVARLSRWEIRALCQLAKTFENRPDEEAL